MTLFPFLISYSSVCSYLLNLTNQVAISQETCIIAWILINFINVWFIITITRIIIKVFKRILKII